MPNVRIAVVGAGAFGRNHLRVIHQSQDADLAGILDIDPKRAAEAAAPYGCPVFQSLEELAAKADAAIVATPTVTHAQVGSRLIELGLDVLVEKPIAQDPAAARSLLEAAARCGKILQVGHLERFNPAVIALESVVGHPLFFEVHRLSEFSPRSLDVDVVLDLMIPALDIANVRLQFPGGCIANLTASRVSTERVRKLRLFQPHEYISLDYSRQDAIRFRVKPPMAIDFAPLPVKKDEPLRLELAGFVESVGTRRPPRVTGEQALAAIEVAHSILGKIKEHSRLVAQGLGAS